ncbi:D-Ala-D-Ala carboxypeptidase family metallohydrolase [Aromatoleum toluolicum]|uniref:DUF882 domain-containing protein n=1 Tax=Aromatoleum toluolicum TaxID=90060 RepID=A0ABX1NGW4_9RHOO|nr:D-Ala-D-Ala carboxypeptidase family metallohydrolase [Aromatoleum toluolicum]NMF98375.1 D-Ala-D-Ala carboxypeptidase family metallohydrolase [Aromatoleum toluolicum]
MNRTRLTPHFCLEELLFSQQAVRHGIGNTPPGSALINLSRLAEVLERIRAAVGNRTVTVTSGYRSPALNQRIGGSRASAHMDGRAADIVVRSMTPLQVARAIQGAGIALDQLIFEGSWVHVGIAKVGEPSRGDVLTAHFGPDGVKYQRGIVAA